MSELPSQVGLHAFVVNAREHDKAVKITPRFGVVGVTGFYVARHSPWGPWLAVVGGGPGVSAMSWSAPIPDPGRGGVPFPPFPGVAVRRAAPRWSGGGPAIRGQLRRGTAPRETRITYGWCIASGRRSDAAAFVGHRASGPWPARRKAGPPPPPTPIPPRAATARAASVKPNL